MPRGRRDLATLEAPVHLRCHQRTHNAYRALGDALDLEFAWLMRQVLDAGAATMEHLAAEVDAQALPRMRALVIFEQLLAGLRAGVAQGEGPCLPQRASSPTVPPAVGAGSEHAVGRGSATALRTDKTARAPRTRGAPSPNLPGSGASSPSRD